MYKTVVLLAVVSAVAGTSSTAVAQTSPAEKSAPSVTIMQNGANELYRDLEFILKLTNSTEQKQWSVLQEYLDIFLIGIDRTRPIRVDLIMGGETERYISSFPITNMKEFRDDNLDSLGIESRKKSKTLYQLKGAFLGYMRHKHEYAIIAERKDEVPVSIADPLEAIAPLLAAEYDLALEGYNHLEGQVHQDQRRKTFTDTRKELLAVLKKTKEETADDFAIRRSLYGHQLDEFERFFVEASKMVLGWTTDVVGQKGRLDIELDPIEGTSLEATIDNLGKSTSYFANIDRSENPIFSAHLNHPLDEMRKTNILETIALLRTRTNNNLNARDDVSDAERDARKEIADKTFGLLEAGAKQGLADGFFEVHANESDKNTIVCGFRAVDGTAVVDILKLVPKAREGQVMQLDVDSEGDVRIHKVVISGKRHANFLNFFGTGDLFIGSTADAVWLSSGENALAELKGAIAKAAAPKPEKPSPVFLDVFVKMAPWMNLRNARAGDKGDVAMRKLAMAAFELGDDTFSLQLRRTDKNNVEGELVANPGILRFAGKLIADFSKENLDDQ